MYKSALFQNDRKHVERSIAKTTVSDLIIQYLEQLNVEFIFGIPGGAIEPLYNAIARGERGTGPRAIVARHETGAAFMAQGYSLETGKLGVCCATTGPGSTNMITGVASAYQEEVPLLVITAQSRLSLFGRRSFQDSSCTGINSLGMFQHCTRYNSLVSDVAQLEIKLVSAIMTAMDNPNGPAHLSIPTDILATEAQITTPSYYLGKLVERSSLLDLASVDSLLNEVSGNGKIVIVLGSGCVNAVAPVLEFAEWANASVIATPTAKGLIDPFHPLFCGIYGFAGHNSARDVLMDSDTNCVLAIGMAMNEWETGGWDQEALLNSKMIHIDSIRSHFVQTPMAKLHISGDIHLLFSTLLQRLKTSNRRSYANKCYNLHGQSDQKTPIADLHDFANHQATEIKCDKSAIKPQNLMIELASHLPNNTCFFSDIGNSSAWAIHYLHLPNPATEGGGWFRTSTQFAAMGWAIGSAVGAALARPNKTVVCITGDGSLLMNGQEITVARQENLDIIFVVLNDSALGMVKHGQRLSSAEAIAFQLPSVDFDLMARAMGINSFQVRNRGDILQLRKHISLQQRGPLLLDVYIDGEEQPPIGERIKVLKN